MRTITINANKLSEAIKCLDKVNKHLSKFKKSIDYDIGADYIKSVDLNTTDGSTLYKVGTISTTCIDIDIYNDDDVICLDGWHIIAKVDKINTRNIVSMIDTNATVNKDWYTMPMTCDHCGTNRKRKTVYIVTDTNGNTKSVGSTCLQDYTGIDPAMLLNYLQVNGYIINDNITVDTDDILINNIYKTSDVLLLAIQAIKQYGYKVASAPDSTKSYVSSHLDCIDNMDADSINKVHDMIDWAINKFSPDFDDNLGQNIKSLCYSDYIDKKYIGYIAYLPVLYDKYNTVGNVYNTYYGNVGDKVSLTVSKIELVTSLSSCYGTTYIYKIIADNHIFLWYASKHQGDDLQAIKKISGTIKDHQEYKGDKQTVLTRCKFS